MHCHILPTCKKKLYFKDFLMQYCIILASLIWRSNFHILINKQRNIKTVKPLNAFCMFCGAKVLHSKYAFLGWNKDEGKLDKKNFTPKSGMWVRLHIKTTVSMVLVWSYCHLDHIFDIILPSYAFELGHFSIFFIK